MTDEDVRTAIKNSGGVKGSLLIPEAPFELLVRRAISRLLPSALQCQQFVHSELLRIAAQCAPADVSRFPALQVGCMSASEAKGFTQNQGGLIDITHLAYMYCTTNDFRCQGQLFSASVLFDHPEYKCCTI